MKEWELEDYLQEQGVFVSGIDGRRCHSDSYMTCVAFDQLQIAFKNSPFSREQWQKAIEYWTTNENMQPPLRMVGFFLKRMYFTD